MGQLKKPSSLDLKIFQTLNMEQSDWTAPIQNSAFTERSPWGFWGQKICHRILKKLSAIGEKDNQDFLNASERLSK